jgi:hypothetical protein
MGSFQKSICSNKRWTDSGTRSKWRAMKTPTEEEFALMHARATSKASREIDRGNITSKPQKKAFIAQMLFNTGVTWAIDALRTAGLRSCADYLEKLVKEGA